jgi:hypothetical protein
MQILLAAFFLEAGLGLLLVPWSSYWDHNYFMESFPVLQSTLTNNFVRGGISGLGVVNVAAGAVELFSVLAAQRRRDEVVTIGRTSGE